MSYRLNEQTWQEVEEIAKSLACLPPGESLFIKDTIPAIDRIRYLVYAWMHETEQKIKFRIMRKSPYKLEIMRKAVIAPTLSREDKVDDFVSCQLIEVDDELQAQQLVRSAVESGELTTDQGIAALSEWNRVQGRT
jgi:hypothetical protein